MRLGLNKLLNAVRTKQYLATNLIDSSFIAIYINRSFARNCLNELFILKTFSVNFVLRLINFMFVQDNKKLRSSPTSFRLHSLHILCFVTVYILCFVADRLTVFIITVDHWILDCDKPSS